MFYVLDLGGGIFRCDGVGFMLVEIMDMMIWLGGGVIRKS